MPYFLGRIRQLPARPQRARSSPRPTVAPIKRPRRTRSSPTTSRRWTPPLRPRSGSAHPNPNLPVVRATVRAQQSAGSTACAERSAFQSGGPHESGLQFRRSLAAGGDLTHTNYPALTAIRRTTKRNFTTHAVLFGQDVDIADIQAVADTDTGENPHHMMPDASLSLCLYLFGNDIRWRLQRQLKRQLQLE